MRRGRTDLELAVEQIRLVGTHEHLGLTRRMQTIDDELRWSRTLPQPVEREWVDDGPDIVEDLFGGYLGADLRVAGAGRAALSRVRDASIPLERRFADLEDAWQAAQLTGYGEAMRLGAGAIYGLEELTAEGLRRAQARLEELQRPGELPRLLRDTAGLDHVQINDLRWARGGDETDPGFFLYDLSWWAFCSGRIELEQILRDTGIEVGTLADLREAMAAIFERFAPCAIAVKSQHAYDRTLRWQARSDDDAARALATTLGSVTVDEATRLVLGDWCWARGVELAIAHDLPFKLHTGYYAGTGYMSVEDVSAAHLSPILARYRDARFVLMHIAYPHASELVVLAKHYPNVWVDLCWAWSIDPYSTADFVRRFLHAVPANKLFAFGGDSIWPTNAVGYAMQARRRLAGTLGSEVAAGDLTEPQAIAIAHRVMRDNQYACFDVAATQTACRAAQPASSRQCS